METKRENLDRNDAADGLDAIAAARRSVRDQPWPTWLYLTNAVLLAGMALTPLVEPTMAASLLALVAGVSLAYINNRAGQIIGTPFAIPTSKVFLGFVIVAGICTVTSVLLRGTVSPQTTIALAVGALLSYPVGSFAHYRSTRK